MQQLQNDNLYSLDNIKAASKNVEFTKLVAEKLNKFIELTGYKANSGYFCQNSGLIFML